MLIVVNLCSEVEGSLRLNNLLQNKASDSSSADVFVHHTMFQVNIVHC